MGDNPRVKAHGIVRRVATPEGGAPRQLSTVATRRKSVASGPSVGWHPRLISSDRSATRCIAVAGSNSGLCPADHEPGPIGHGFLVFAPSHLPPDSGRGPSCLPSSSVPQAAASRVRSKRSKGASRFWLHPARPLLRPAQIDEKHRANSSSAPESERHAVGNRASKRPAPPSNGLEANRVAEGTIGNCLSCSHRHEAFTIASRSD